MSTLRLAESVADAGFDYVLTVPCTILSEWYAPSELLHTIYLSREEEGVGMAAGLLAAGRSPLLLIQNSGLGNCINAIASLGLAYGVPIIVAVSLRGDRLDENPAQKPIGEATPALVSALGCKHAYVSPGDAARALRALREIAERERRPQFAFLPRRAALC